MNNAYEIELAKNISVIGNTMRIILDGYDDYSEMFDYGYPFNRDFQSVLIMFYNSYSGVIKDNFFITNNGISERSKLIKYITDIVSCLSNIQNNKYMADLFNKTMPRYFDRGNNVNKLRTAYIKWLEMAVKMI